VPANANMARRGSTQIRSRPTPFLIPNAIVCRTNLLTFHSGRLLINSMYALYSQWCQQTKLRRWFVFCCLKIFQPNLINCTNLLKHQVPKGTEINLVVYFNAPALLVQVSDSKGSLFNKRSCTLAGIDITQNR
jgi:hypothetical protein